MIKIEEKVSSTYRQHYEEESSQVQEECDPKVYGENVEKKLQSIINSIGDQSALFLMAVRDCIVNKRSQAEIAPTFCVTACRTIGTTKFLSQKLSISVLLKCSKSKFPISAYFLLQIFTIYLVFLQKKKRKKKRKKKKLAPGGDLLNSTLC